MNQDIEKNIKQLFSLEGRIALVTGSARGIGRAIAVTLAEFGATVAVHGVGPSEPLESVLAETRALHPGCVAVTGDLALAGAGANLIQAVTNAIGAPDIVIANASVQIRKPWLELTPEESLLQMQVNFHATLQMMQAAYPAMRDRKWGRLISVGSVQERKPHVEMPVYAASKSALENLVRNLAKIVGTDNITVNNICPGVFDTDRNKEALDNPDYAGKVRACIPIRDFAEPRDAVGAALLICSEAGRYITGTTICIDGGMAIT